MTTTDEFDGPPPSPPLAPRHPQRVLRRSRTDRVGAGVAGGLGEYFRVDPVLFRVLFATAALFGGIGVIAYLLAWVAIPEQGTANAPVERFVRELRRRRVPVWLVAGVAGLILWCVVFSWWAPSHFFPVIVLVIVLVAILGRHGRVDHLRARDDAATDAPEGASVDLTKSAADDSATGAGSPAWVHESRRWMIEAKAASRLRRRRAMPVRVGTLATLVLTLTVLGLVDAATGIAIPIYFWAGLGIVGLGLLTGLVLRRTPWILTTLLVPAMLGVVSLGGSTARLHDGFGERSWTPTSTAALDSHYRLAFGRATLDLRNLAAIDATRTIKVTVGAGEVRLLLPPTMNVTVDANIRFGDLQVNRANQTTDGGFNLNRRLLPATGATGPALTIDVHVTDGRIDVDRRS